VVLPHLKVVHVTKEHTYHKCTVAIPKGAIALSVDGGDIRWYSEYFFLSCIEYRIEEVPRPK